MSIFRAKPKRTQTAGAGAGNTPKPLEPGYARFNISNSLAFASGRTAAEWTRVGIVHDEPDSDAPPSVYLSHLKGTRSVYAIKKLMPRWDHAGVDEKRAMVQLSKEGAFHPNLAAMLADFEEEGEQYMAMEYFPRGDLAELIGRARAPIPLAQVALYARQLADAILFIHARGIIHRDIKCENVLVRGNGHVVLADLGVAYLAPENEAITELIPRGRIGTEEYMSPEMDRGDAYNHTVDWWALGVTIFVLIYNQAPFSDPQLIRNVFCVLVNHELELMFPHTQGIPESLQDLIYELLEKDPLKRLDDLNILRHPFFAEHRSLIAHITALPSVPGFDHAREDNRSVVVRCPEECVLPPEEDPMSQGSSRRSSTLSFSSKGSKSSNSQSSGAVVSPKLLRGLSGKIVQLVGFKRAGMGSPAGSALKRPQVELPNVSYLYDL